MHLCDSFQPRDVLLCEQDFANAFLCTYSIRFSPGMFLFASSTLLMHSYALIRFVSASGCPSLAAGLCYCIRRHLFDSFQPRDVLVCEQDFANAFAGTYAIRFSLGMFFFGSRTLLMHSQALMRFVSAPGCSSLRAGVR